MKKLYLLVFLFSSCMISASLDKQDAQNFHDELMLQSVDEYDPYSLIDIELPTIDRHDINNQQETPLQVKKRIYEQTGNRIEADRAYNRAYAALPQARVTRKIRDSLPKSKAQAKQRREKKKEQLSLNTPDNFNLLIQQYAENSPAVINSDNGLYRLTSNISTLSLNSMNDEKNQQIELITLEKSTNNDNGINALDNMIHEALTEITSPAIDIHNSNHKTNEFFLQNAPQSSNEAHDKAEAIKAYKRDHYHKNKHKNPYKKPSSSNIRILTSDEIKQYFACPSHDGRITYQYYKDLYNIITSDAVLTPTQIRHKFIEITGDELLAEKAYMKAYHKDALQRNAKATQNDAHNETIEMVKLHNNNLFEQYNIITQQKLANTSNSNQQSK